MSNKINKARLGGARFCQQGMPVFGGMSVRGLSRVVIPNFSSKLSEVYSISNFPRFPFELLEVHSLLMRLIDRDFMSACPESNVPHTCKFVRAVDEELNSIPDLGVGFIDSDPVHSFRVCTPANDVKVACPIISVRIITSRWELSVEELRVPYPSNDGGEMLRPEVPNCPEPREVHVDYAILPFP